MTHRLSSVVTCGCAASQAYLPTSLPCRMWADKTTGCLLTRPRVSPKASFSVMQTLLWAPCHIAGNGPSGAAELRGGVSRWAHQGRWLRRARSVREATGNRRPGLARAGSKRHSRSAFTTKLAGWRHARSTFAS
jgi:hypothetical protein